ncbi:MAG TPA: 4-alpha-glucanotransferase, partial [Chromatiales bacterium]|nr:4-alpha-glucanotransferase [Chromatiales bacterium]
MEVLDRRRAGVLLHPGSLPGPFGSGVLGSEARRFVDLIAAAGFTVWQTLPLGPVDSTLSPYQLKSAFAGNPALIDERETGSLAATDSGSCIAFVRRNRRWLLPYALFDALRARYQGVPWWAWPAPLRDREPAAVRHALSQERAAVRRTISTQFMFELQWRALRSYAADKGVSIFGDLPFYVDLDSADVWWHRSLFQLDTEGRPTAVAGVPPDYFSADGQLWGNPL